MTAHLRGRLLEVLKAVAPLVLSVCALQLLVVHAPIGDFLQFLAGSALAVIGMLLLFIGIDLGILPMGRFIGAELPRRGSLLLMPTVAFSIGFATTVPEPDVLVLARQVDQASGGAVAEGTVLYTIALGLAALVALGMARIVLGWSMRLLLTVGYLLALALAVLAPPSFVSLAFDGGSVTTGVLSAPILLALAIGTSSVLAGRSAASDGFGLVGLGSIGPIIAILVMSLLRS